MLTGGLHFVILTVRRAPDFAQSPWTPMLFTFRWPSVPYAIDILAWDVFFALAVLFAAPVFGTSRLGRAIRALLIASGVLALAGVAGGVTGDMQVRNIGIVGYAGLFPIAAALIAIEFRRTPSA